MEDRSVSMARANAWALLVLGPVVAALTAAFVARHGWGPLADVGEVPPLVLLGALLGGVLAHEGLHALAWKLAAALPWRDLKLGFQWKTLTPYAHARVPMPAFAYRVGAAAPGVVLGLLPVAAALVTGDGAWFLFGLLFTFAAGGDALILWLLRGVEPERLVEDHPTRAGCYVHAATGEGRAEARTPPEAAGTAPESDPSPLVLAPSPLVTTHDAPPTAGRDRAAEWAEALTYAEFLPTAERYPELWTGNYDRAVLPDDIRARVAALPGRWHLLVLSADWCIDAVAPVPVLARLADEAPNLALRLLDRDAHLALMDEHLTGGTARAIPAVILLDDRLVERAWWGPRPAALQAWFKGEAQALVRAERYRRSRQWYARDRGATALEEVVGMIERAAGLRPALEAA